MDLQAKREAGAMVLTITGRLDAATSTEYESRFDSLGAINEALVVVDFDKLDHISSAGLRALLVTARKLRSNGGQISFANIRGAVKEVFDISGVATVFQMHDSLAAALFK
jgi:stage II sporulation protein AA (anti-sigma F factor antagonist)